jgi:hypothetical protein
MLKIKANFMALLEASSLWWRIMKGQVRPEAPQRFTKEGLSAYLLYWPQL